MNPDAPKTEGSDPLYVVASELPVSDPNPPLSPLASYLAIRVMKGVVTMGLCLGPQFCMHFITEGYHAL